MVKEMPSNKKDFVFNSNTTKDRIKAKVKLAKEFADREKQLNEEKVLLDEQVKTELNNNSFNVINKKLIARQEQIARGEYRIKCLQEFAASISYGALPVDSDIKEKNKDKIIKTVYEYFDSASNGTLMKAISKAQNQTPHYSAVAVGSARVDDSLIRFFDSKYDINNSYAKVDAPHGRVSALDFLTVTNQNNEPEGNLNKINENLNRLANKCIDIVRKKVVTLMKEEAEISQAAKFLQEGLKTDPGFEIKNKPLKFKANKNTLFREIYKTTKLVNENYTGSNDDYMAESLLQLTIMECMNTLYLETINEKDRMLLLQKKRLEHSRKK
jgi:ribosomal protein L31E